MEIKRNKHKFEIILETINGGIFKADSILRQKQIPDILIDLYKDQYNIDLSNCKRYTVNMFGNLDAIFIYGAISNNKMIYDWIELCDKVCIVIFVDNLLSKLNRLSKNNVYEYVYKIRDKDDKCVGFAKSFTKRGNGFINVRKEDSEGMEFSGIYKYPSNCEYLLELNKIFCSIIKAIKPDLDGNTTMSHIYSYMPQILAIYSHMLTIGRVDEEDAIFFFKNNKEFLDYVQDSNLIDLIYGSFMKYTRKD